MASMNTDKGKVEVKNPGPTSGAPAAPAQKAAKPKREAKVLTPEQQALKAKLDEARKQFNQAVGKPVKVRSTTPTYGGFTGEEVVTVVPGGMGFSNDTQKAVAAKIGSGMKMKDLLAANLDGVDGFAWIRYRLIGGGIKLNGKSVSEAFAAAK